MEQNFQTSFIPKKPMVRETVVRSHSIGFLTIIALFFLFTVLVATGGLYFYRGIVAKSVSTKEKELTFAKERFEPSRIQELQVLDKRLNAANEILSKHIAISPIFEALQAITMKSVRFTDFSYNFGDDVDSKINVQMSGVSLGYSFLALQSDLFANEKNFIDPIFSNLALNEVGNVTFDLNFSLEPSFVNYKGMLLTKENTSNSSEPNINSEINLLDEDLDTDFDNLNLNLDDL